MRCTVATTPSIPQAQFGFEMKRKATARCAAANDDEALDELFDSPPTSAIVAPGRADSNAKRQKEAPLTDGSEVAAAARDGAAPGSAKKKEKEFAWMDSDDDEADPEEELEKMAEVAKEDNVEDGEATSERLDAVQSFGRMILLAPAIQKRLRSEEMASEDVVAACRAMARTKFFDGEILADLSDVLQKMLLSAKLDVLQTNDVIQCLWTLNAYEKSVFTAIATAFQGRTMLMEASMRKEWLQIFNKFGHAHEEEFIQLLDVPQELPMSPHFRKIRCQYFAQGSCAFGEACSFLHDMHAPLSLNFGSDFISGKQTVMTANQESLGCTQYGACGRGSASFFSPAGRGAPLAALNQHQSQSQYLFKG